MMEVTEVKFPSDAYLLRVFIGESDKVGGKPLYEAIVEKALEMELAGATVLRGILGYGANDRIHTSKLLRLSESLPWWWKSWTTKRKSTTSFLSWTR